MIVYYKHVVGLWQIVMGKCYCPHTTETLSVNLVIS